MRLLIGCLFSAFLACLFSTSHAQVAEAVLEGRIVTENGTPADASTVVLLKSRDSSIVTSAIADNTGIFHFADLQAGSYLLLISKAGYKKMYAGPYNTVSGETFITPRIVLKQLVQSLSEVSVVSNRPDIEARPGKLILNVQNNLSAQGNSAFDILRQSPGVRVDNSNNINIIGRQSALITIDDKPVNLSGEDLVAVLRGIQASTIDRIELVTGGSAKYDASAGGIINIVLKKGKNNGFNGSFTGVAGYGKYHKSNAGIVFNARTNKFNIFGNYSYSDNKNVHNITTDRNINFNDTLSNYHTDYNSLQAIHVNTFGLGTDFYLSKTQTIGFFVNGSVTNENFAKNNNLTIYNQGIYDSTITAVSNLKRNVSRINYNLNYSGKLDSAGKTLTADLNYTTNNRTSDEYITNMFYDASGNQYRSSEWLQNLSPSNIKVWLSRVDFSDPISKTSKFEAGIKFSDVISDNHLIFGPFVNGAYTSDPKFSNHFKYTENVNAAYANYQNRFNKFDLVAGLRAEQTIATGNSSTRGEIVNSNYTGLFPSVMLTYSADTKNDWTISYNRGIKRPGYEDINPFLYYLDLYDYRSGNPDLKPEYTTNIELSYNYNKTLLTTLYVNIINEAYEFRYFVQNDSSKVNINIPKNFGSIYNYGIRFLTPATLTNWWNIDFKVDAAYQRYVAYPANGNLNKGTQDVILSGDQHFKISKTITADLFGSYETPSFYGISQFKANYYLDAYIGTQLFNSRVSLKLSMNDVFNTRRDRFSTNYQNLYMNTIDKTETQVVKLTFTYRFGKVATKSALHRTGNEDEQTRLNSINEN